MRVPEVWTILNDGLWHLPERDAATLWSVASRARWTRVVRWRQQIALMGHVMVSDGLLAQVSPPRVIVAVLEDLVREGLLRRCTATQFEEHLLRHVQAAGGWRGDPESEQVRTTWHAPDIVTLAETGQASP